jgi:hypothetical protein
MILARHERRHVVPLERQCRGEGDVQPDEEENQPGDIPGGEEPPVLRVPDQVPESADQAVVAVSSADDQAQHEDGERGDAEELDVLLDGRSHLRDPSGDEFVG